MTTMMMLGPVAFQLRGLNPTKISYERKIPFAEHKVIGSEPVKEFMALGSKEVEIEGTIFPFSQTGIGGLEGIAALEIARDSAIPLPLVRADGGASGWFLIEEVKSKHDTLAATGVGREVEFSAKLCSSGTPSAGSLARIFGLFGF